MNKICDLIVIRDMRINRLYIKHFIISAIILFSIPSCSALEQMSVEKNAILSVNDCINIALNNSPEVRKARYNYGVSKGNLGVAKSSYFPTLGIGTGYNYTGSNSDRTKTDTTIYSAEASINQLLFDFGKTNANIRQYNFNRISALYDFENTVLTTIFNVKTKYYAVLAAKATMDVNKGNVQINERNYQRTKAYFDEGIKSKIDLVNAEVNLSDSKIVLLNSEKVYQNAVVALNNSMYIAYAPEYEIETTETFNFEKHLAPVSLVHLEDKAVSHLPKNIDDAFLTANVEKLDVLENFQFKPFEYTFDEAVEIAYKNRPDLKSYNAKLEAMKEALKYVKREYLPAISAKAGYGYRDQYNTNSLNAGINLSASINAKAEKHKIDNAKYQVKLAQNQIDLSKQNIYFEVQNLYVNMTQLEKQIPLLAVAVKQTLENFELADGRYAVGLGDYIQLQDAKVNYNVAQVNYVQTVYNYSVARANLEKAIALPQSVTISVED